MSRICISLLLVLCLVEVSNAAEAPDFSVASNNGVITLKQQRGQVVYLDFWASWCVPCRKSFPWLNNMHARYGKAGLKVIAINLDEDKQQAENFLKKIPAQFTIGYDPQGKTAGAYDVKGMPSSYLIDRNGQILFTHLGFHDRDRQELENRIRQALKN